MLVLLSWNTLSNPLKQRHNIRKYSQFLLQRSVVSSSAVKRWTTTALKGPKLSIAILIMMAIDNLRPLRSDNWISR